MQHRAFDLLITEVTLAPRPFGLYPLLHSSRDSDWTNAFTGLQDDDLDDVLEALWTGTDEETAQDGSKRALVRISELTPYVPVCTRPNRMGFHGLHDLNPLTARGADEWRVLRLINMPLLEASDDPGPA